MKFLILLLFVVSCYTTSEASPYLSDTADTVIRKIQMYGGGVITVPENKIWEITSITCSDGMYPVAVTSVKPDSALKAGETYVLPFWIAEAELLSGNNGDLFYNFTIKEYSTDHD